MSDVVWKLSSDGQNPPYNDLFAALKTGLILGGSATSFSMKDGPAVVIFQGSFTVVNGTITAGTISGFQVFHNSPARQADGRDGVFDQLPDLQAGDHRL